MSAGRCLAVVPARGGSRGLPGKNVRPLAGLPLLVHSLRCAALCPEITRTIVSTDNEGIAGTAREHGGDVPFLRPAELARDETPMMPVLAHAVAAAEQDEGEPYDSVLLLDPTSPARLPSDVAAAHALLAGTPDTDAVVACSEPTFNPFWVGVVERGDGLLAPAFPDAARHHRRQDVPPFLRINGALYLYRRPAVDVDPADLRIAALPFPEQRAFSIDEAWEFERLEALLGAGVLALPWLQPS